jgi:hypothetical protein
MPGQGLEEMVDTLIFLAARRVLIGPSIYYPTPGTPLFKRCEREGFLPPHPSQWRSSAFPIQTKEFDRMDLLTLLRLARTVNLVKKKMDEKILEEGMTWEEILQALKDRPGGPTRCAGAEKGDRAWPDLLLLLLKERTFFGLGKTSGGGVSLFRNRSSKRVVDLFFEKSWDVPILRSKQA